MLPVSGNPLEQQIRRPRQLRKVALEDLGFASDYQWVWNHQKEIVAKRVNQLISDRLILVEHDHVLTMGVSGHGSNILENDLPIFQIERGGDVTYHGPGQLVIYPIVSLQERALGVRQFVELVEGSMIDTLACFNLSCEGKLGKDTGVWVDGRRKIASIGVAVSHWVTFHGVALNVNTDLSYFQKIKPCGFESSVMTSLSKELGEKADLEKVKRIAIQKFLERFESS